MAGSLAPLATADDLASRLGRDLTQQEAIRAEFLLSDASAQIRRYCRRDFLVHTDEVVPALYGRDGEIKLPYRPVTGVSAVVARGFTTPALTIPDLPVPWYTFDGVDRIRLDSGLGVIANLPEIWWTSDVYPHTFDVTMSWGDPAGIPDDVNMVCANAALSVLTSPTMAAGVIGETLGPYSYRMERTGGGVSVALTQADLAILRDYRNTTGTIMTRLQ